MTYTHILVLFSGQKRCNINYTNHSIESLKKELHIHIFKRWGIFQKKTRQITFLPGCNVRRLLILIRIDLENTLKIPRDLFSTDFLRTYQIKIIVLILRQTCSIMFVAFFLDKFLEWSIVLVFSKEKKINHEALLKRLIFQKKG